MLSSASKYVSLLAFIHSSTTNLKHEASLWQSGELHSRLPSTHQATQGFFPLFSPKMCIPAALYQFGNRQLLASSLSTNMESGDQFVSEGQVLCKNTGHLIMWAGSQGTDVAAARVRFPQITRQVAFTREDNVINREHSEAHKRYCANDPSLCEVPVSKGAEDLSLPRIAGLLASAAVMTTTCIS